MGHFDRLRKRAAAKAQDSATWSIDQAVIETGRMVYEWRMSAGLSQQDLAKAIGTKQESISRIERGLSKEGPRLKTLAAIADACGQRFIISGGSPAAVGPAAQWSADSAWGVCAERPRRANESSVHAPAAPSKNRSEKIDIELVEFDFMNSYLRKQLEAQAVAGSRFAAKAKSGAPRKATRKRAGKLHVTSVSKVAGSYVMHGVELQKTASRSGKNPKISLNLLDLMNIEK